MTKEKILRSPSGSLAKITRPRLPGVYPRKRLFRLLDNARKRPVVWITGPPGSGKTTLIGSYLDVCKFPSLWYQVDEGDGDAATFFYYMREASIKSKRSKRKPLPLFTPEYLGGLSTFTKNYFRELYHRLKPPFIVVLDNYQEVSSDSLFHQLISDALSEIPEGGNVILISRGGPPPSLSRLRANSKMSFISWHDLRLTFEESRGIVKIHGQKGLSKEAVKQLHIKMDGWAAGLALVLEQGKTREPGPKSISDSTPEVIFDYFANEILGKTDIKTREFLLKTAFLNRMTPGMAEDLTKIRGAGKVLSKLNRRNYFTIKHTHPTPVYQYHQLFREFLIDRAKTAYTPLRLANIQREASKLLEKDGQVEDAVLLLQEARNYDGIADIILKHAPSMLKQGRGKTLLKWLGGLPEEMLEKRPWLLYWLGTSLLPFNPGQSQSHLERAYELFKKGEERLGRFLALTGVIHTIVQLGRNYCHLDQWFEILDEIHRENPVFLPKEIEEQVTPIIFHALAFRKPDYPRFNYWLEKNQQLFRKCHDTNLRITAGYTLANHFIWQGDFSNAAHLFDSFQKLLRFKMISPLSVIFIQTLESFYCWLAGLPERSLKAVASCQQTSKSSGVHIWDSHVVGFGACGAITAGDFEKAEGFLNEMASSMDWNRIFDAVVYHLGAAWIELIRRDFHKAKKHCEMLLKFANDLGATLPLAIGNYAMSQIFHESGDYRKAESFLKKAIEVGRQMKSDMIEFMCLLAKAQYALDRGKEKQAIESLKKAMTLGKERDYVNFYLFRPDVMARLCLKALDAGIEVEYVQDLIRRRNLTMDSPPLECENWPWPIRIYTLGRFELVIDGKPLKFSGKAQKKPLELLQALITFGGRDVSKRQLSDLLWPEADGYAADRSFITTLQRLRKLVRQKDAIELREENLSLNPRYCWVDTWEYERVSTRVETIKNEDIKERIDLITKALNLYRGHFLGNDPDLPWAISYHERLRNIYQRHISEMGHWFEEGGNWKKAVEVYRKGLEMDELNEELYRRKMICHSNLGNRARAISIYHRCRKTLFSTLEIEPSPETEAIYLKLKEKR